MIFIIVVLILALDQLTKLLVTSSVVVHQSIPVVKNIFHITLVANRGAAFGILKDQATLFIFAAIFAVGLIYVNIRKSGPEKISLYKISLVLILAGAMGNLIDRLRFGYVVDFLDFRIWPVFNVADSAITIGAILLGWIILFGKSAKP